MCTNTSSTVLPFSNKGDKGQTLQSHTTNNNIQHSGKGMEKEISAALSFTKPACKCILYTHRGENSL